MISLVIENVPVTSGSKTIIEEELSVKNLDKVHWSPAHVNSAVTVYFSPWGNGEAENPFKVTPSSQHTPFKRAKLQCIRINIGKCFEYLAIYFYKQFATKLKVAYF